MSPRFSVSEIFLRTQSDERLVTLIADGHPRAFSVLVERHRLALLRTAARVIGPQRAEDVAQEALLRAWRALEAGTRVGHVQAWLHQIVRNTAYSAHALERGVTAELPEDLADPMRLAQVLDQRQLAREVLVAVAALPERQRAALVETELGGRSRHEIATDLGLSEGAVRQLVHRARHAVRVAVTALTPYPLAAWAAQRGEGPSTAERLAVLGPPPGSGRTGVLESIAAGSAAGGGTLVKAGAVLIATGALGGGVALRSLSAASSHRAIAGLRHAAGPLRASQHASGGPVATAAVGLPLGAILSAPGAVSSSVPGRERVGGGPLSGRRGGRSRTAAGGRSDGAAGGDGARSSGPQGDGSGSGTSGSGATAGGGSTSSGSDGSGGSSSDGGGGSAGSTSGTGSTSVSGSTSGTGSDGSSGTSGTSGGSDSSDQLPAPTVAAAAVPSSGSGSSGDSNPSGGSDGSSTTSGSSSTSGSSAVNVDG